MNLDLSPDLDLVQARELLPPGAWLTPKGLWEGVRQQSIPRHLYVRFGRRLFFRKTLFLAWLADGGTITRHRRRELAVATASRSPLEESP